MTSSATTTKRTPSDSSKVLAIENLSRPRQAADEYGESRESNVNDIEPGDDDLEDDDEEELEELEDPDLRGKQTLKTSGSTKTGNITPSKDDEEKKKAEEGNNGGK